MKNKNNFVIIEGFWGIGKTAVAEDLKKNGFNFIKEPEGPNKNIKGKDEISNWYLKQHKIREKEFKNNNNFIVLERSELSTFSYNYIKSKKIPTPKEIAPIIKLIKNKKILLVYLSLPTKNSNLIKKNDKVHGKEILNIINNQTKINLYEKWYREIMPHKFETTPFIINLINTKRLKSDKIAKDIVSCLKSNRVAQVNVVVCRYNNKKIEVLILKRTKKRGGFWQAITGGVHIGESLIDAATREIKEELALSVPNIKYTNFFHSFMGNDDYILHEYVYTILISKKNSLKIKISEEHEEYKWVDKKTALSYLKFENNKKAIKKSIKIIKAIK